jgi:hypothetical protein
MEKKLPNLPMELINKILIMRPTHPVANLIKKYIRCFNRHTYIDSDPVSQFPRYILELIFDSNDNYFCKYIRGREIREQFKNVYYLDKREARYKEYIKQRDLENENWRDLELIEATLTDYEM